jgi:transposase
MARRPLSMRKAREILRLRHEVGLGVREIARSVCTSHSTVVKYLKRAEAAGLSWPLPEAIDEERLLRAQPPRAIRRPLPDMAQMHKELRKPRRKKGVTIRLLWEEYRAENPDGYGYTQFCEHYRRFRGRVDPVLRQPYKAGEKLFVDWAGETIPLVGPAAAKARVAYLFVATMGASNYTYAEAFECTQLPMWIEAHIRAWEFFGGVTEITVPDNPKTSVIKPCRYEPGLNRTYEDLASHYGTVIIPARTGAAQDKAKVEKGVQEAERRILAVLRHQTFFSLGELNAAIRTALDIMNRRPFQKMPGCRKEMFEELDRPALKPLPPFRYELAQWRIAKANIDYHVQIDWHCYSVPYALANQEVEVRQTVRTVEIFHRGKRIALHARSQRRGGYTTDPAHRPKAHQRHLEWTPSRLVNWAGRDVGPACARAVARLLESKPHPEQGYRACLGIIRLRRQYKAQRLESACRRAVELDVCSYRSIR